MPDFLEHGLMTVWCVTHRRDLAFESIEATVPEVRHWLALGCVMLYLDISAF